MSQSTDNGVLAIEEKLTIPTYQEPAFEPMPMFAENRVHQRTSGRPYPNAVVLKTDRTGKIDKTYATIRLENEFLSIIIIPELGGRIFSATDKTTGYDFFYRQHVIKPALIGVLGSWISGGVEFNWPFHHRPSTFMPVDYSIENDADGSVTVWLSEHDPMERMKGMVGVRLRPGEAMFETRMQLSNRTPVTRSFLWWENAAVPVNKDYQIFFPPDVSYVNFHYHRSVTTWPLASGVFNGIRLGDNIDIRRHENTKSPTSYFSAASQYDFFGGYDHGKNCGVVHVANHHTSPGKKLFTWAYNQLSKSWEKALTDNDGAYAELMAGSYTDNQPDFAWLEPYETKKFSQFWYPIGAIGAPTCANTNLALSVSKTDSEITLCIQSVRDHSRATIRVSSENVDSFTDVIDLAAGKPVRISVGTVKEPLSILITDASGKRLLHYIETKPTAETIPEPWVDMPAPEKFTTAQELHLAGVHVDQYRDPCTLPNAYWNQALLRDPEYTPALIDLGLFYYKRAHFPKALIFLEKARSVLTRHNPNPKNGEVFYALGLTLLALERIDEAYDAFYKATWNEAYISRSMTMLACIDGRRGEFDQMQTHAQCALANAVDNPLARNLAAAAELRLGDTTSALALLDCQLTRDPLNHLARFLRARACKESLADFHANLHSSPSQTCLDLAYDLINAGLDDEANDLLESLSGPEAPMAHYTRGILALKAGRTDQATALLAKGESTPSAATFPWRLEELSILRRVVATNPGLPKAWYHLGNLLYDKGHYEEASNCWKKSIDLDCSFHTTHRNLAVAYFSHLKLRKESLMELQKALALAPCNEQLVYETVHVMTKLGVDSAKRVEFLLEQCKYTPPRDDILLEWTRALSQDNKPSDALKLLTSHTFVPCEGGEHAVAEQFMFAHHCLGRHALRDEQFSDALDHFRTAQALPDNLGAGLWNEVMLVPHQYHEALCLEKLGQSNKADDIYRHILELTVDYFSNMHLPALPVYQARALRKLGKSARGEELLRKILTQWTQALTQSSAGFFKSTPFFISYIDQPNRARTAHYRYLTGLTRLALNDKDGALADLQLSTDADPGNLYAWLELEELKRIK